MIYHYNPKKHQVWIPDAKLTIPCVKSLEKAHKIIDDAFDPTQWQCVVTSKNGAKLYNYPDRKAAEEDALKKCTKTSTYIVYENGKPVAAFVNNKRLPNYKEIAWKNTYTAAGYGKLSGKDNPYDDYKEKQIHWYSHGHKINAIKVDKYPWDQVVERCEDRIRFKRRTLHLYLTKSGKHVSRFISESLTIHKDGRWFINRNGKISRRDYNFAMDKKLVEAAFPTLEEFKPGISLLVDLFKYGYENVVDVATIFAKPNLFYSTDTYRHEVQRRVMPLGKHAMYRFWKCMPKQYTDESKLVPMLAQKIGVPTSKQFKKIYLNDIANMLLVKDIMECGFKNPNNIISLPHLGMYVQEDLNHDTTKEFINKLICMKGENWVTRAFIREGARSISDTGVMYQRIDTIIADEIIKGSTNLRQIHDTYVRQLNRRNTRRINKSIKYTKEERERLEHSYPHGGKEVTFSLPEDTLTLAVIGMQMGICVGGYDYKALSRASTIVQVKAGNEYIACIELIANCMVQLKAKFNNMVKAEYKTVIDKWIIDANIEIETSDYCHIGEKWGKDFNYAFIDPANFQRNDDNDTLKIVQVGPGTFDHDSEIDYWLGENRFEAVEKNELFF